MNNFIQRTLSAFILLPLVFYFITEGSLMTIFFILFCFIIACYEWYMLSRKFTHKNYGFVFLVISFYSFYKLSIDVYDVLFVILICVFTDIGGYVFGKIFKGPKLTKISPNKTYAGVIGAYILSLLALIIFTQYIGLNSNSYIKLIFITFLISSISQTGDLVISFFKRQTKIKNTGKIIPGHGGLLDRIDGMIFAIPTLYVLKLTGFFAL